MNLASTLVRLPVRAWLRQSALYSERYVAQLIADWFAAQERALETGVILRPRPPGDELSEPVPDLPD